MSNIVRNLPKLVAQSTGTGSVTQGIGKLDDASSITIFLQSTAGFALGAIGVQVSQFDPFDPQPQPGVSESTGWNILTGQMSATSSSATIVISNISFKGLRLSGTSSSATSEVVAFVSKQISV